MKIEKLEAKDLNENEKRGAMQRAKLGAIHAMTVEGAPLEMLLDMEQVISTLTTTIWTICAVKACSRSNDESAKIVLDSQEKQYNACLAEIKTLFDFCDHIREQHEKKIN